MVLFEIIDANLTSSWRNKIMTSLRSTISNREWVWVIKGKLCEEATVGEIEALWLTANLRKRTRHQKAPFHIRRLPGFKKILNSIRLVDTAKLTTRQR